ncbi:MAG: sugar phosphate isomerase/epimerase [Clostridia bacterium]|nr:sugar phosphate isomerase/epimerase [Clostridia bacterium]
MYKLGLSTCGKTVDENLFKSYSEAGIKAMELSMNSEDYDVFDYENALRLSQKYDVELWSFHLPFMPFNELDISAPSLKNDTVSYLKSLIEKASSIGIKRFIIHSSGEPVFEREARMEIAKESLKELADFAKTFDAVICVEDLPRTCLGRNSDEILELISAHDSLKVCLDTNHLLSENLSDFIKKVGDKIITTHISDYDFVDEKHWLPFEGKINWDEVVSALNEINYDGVWLYEIGFKAPWSMPRERDLTCDDFRKNAEKIFNKAE